MTKTRILPLLLILLLPCVSYSLTSRSDKSDPSASWTKFYTAFRAAVNRRDKEAMLRMMPNDFFDGGGGMTAKQWLKFIDENAKNGSWRDLQKSFSQGTTIDQESSRNGKVTRVTKDEHYYFEFRKNKRWYFAGVAGD